jgi:hypothetical protein
MLARGCDGPTAHRIETAKENAVCAMNLETMRLLVKELGDELGMRSDAASSETVDDSAQRLVAEIRTHPFVKGIRPEQLQRPALVAGISHMGNVN